jgi:hypothetical protein
MWQASANEDARSSPPEDLRRSNNKAIPCQDAKGMVMFFRKTGNLSGLPLLPKLDHFLEASGRE